MYFMPRHLVIPSKKKAGNAGLFPSRHLVVAESRDGGRARLDGQADADCVTVCAITCLNTTLGHQ